MRQRPDSKDIIRAHFPPNQRLVQPLRQLPSGRPTNRTMQKVITISPCQSRACGGRWVEVGLCSSPRPRLR